jgi:hypothetical protein
VTLKQSTRPPAVPGGGARRKAKRPRSHAYDAWQLPSGKRLAEFALDSGFLAPPLMENNRPSGRREKGAL